MPEKAQLQQLQNGLQVALTGRRNQAITDCKWPLIGTFSPLVN
jgi:hypothetical protein